MPLTYGSTPQPLRITREEFAPPSQRETSYTGIIRGGLMIAEILSAFIPGLSVAAETAIALSFGAANEALDVKEGNASVFGTLANLGIPLAAGRYTARLYSREFAQIETLSMKNQSDLTRVRGILEAENSIFYNPESDLMQQLAYEELSTPTFAGREMIRTHGLKTYIKEYSKKIEQLTTSRLFGTYAESMAEKLSQNIETKVISRTGGEAVDKATWQEQGFTNEQAELIVQYWAKGISQAEKQAMLGGFISFLKSFKNLSTEARAFITQFELQVKTYYALALEAGEEAMATAVHTAIRDMGQPWVSAQETKRFWRYLGSTEFNDKWVQRLQLIDPNDLGRAPVEYMYKKIMRSIRGAKRIEQVSKELSKIEEEFERAGGIVLSSSWILGYKLLKETPLRDLILIHFRPDNTNSKPPVMVWASKKKILQFATNESPGAFYINNWATSRGPRMGIGFNEPNNMFNNSSAVLRSFMAFIPVEQLRNILSIVSNYVENISDMISGRYTKQYKDKLWNSFFNTSISRTFRLFGKGYLRNIATEAFGKETGRVVGIEAQRIGTNIGAYSIKRAIAGKKIDLGHQFMMGMVNSGRSHSLRKLRNRRPNSVVVKSFTGARKARFVRRIPNAVTPGRKFRGIKLQGR